MQAIELFQVISNRLEAICYALTAEVNFSKLIKQMTHLRLLRCRKMLDLEGRRGPNNLSEMAKKIGVQEEKEIIIFEMKN